MRLFVYSLVLLFGLGNAFADKREVTTLQLADETEVEIRVFQSEGERLLLGFACDEGASINQEATASRLAEDGIEVWMPDMLGAYFLPKLPSSIQEIPTDATVEMVRQIKASTGKQIIFIAGGVETELVLRTLAELERAPDLDKEFGAILLFPRLVDGEPQPGTEPQYFDAVGKTSSPLLIIEGERTPNRWGLTSLSEALAAGGSPVQSLVVPEIRGFFYSRPDANENEELVTRQMHGLIKAGLFQLRSNS